MSWVTNLVLHIRTDHARKDERLAQVNRYFAEYMVLGAGLVSVHDPKLPSGWYGGSKVLETELYVGAYNYLDLEDFLGHLRSIDWETRETVQVIVMDQHDDRFRIVDVHTPDD